VDSASDSSHLVDQMSKSDGNGPPPVVAATFTHSMLIESTSAPTVWVIFISDSVSLRYNQGTSSC
jgi:hypothetical protein